MSWWKFWKRDAPREGAPKDGVFYRAPLAARSNGVRQRRRARLGRLFDGRRREKRRYRDKVERSRRVWARQDNQISQGL